MKFFALAALVATTQAAADASVADGAACTAGADKECTTVTSSCCKGWKNAAGTTALDVAASYCSPAVTGTQTALSGISPEAFLAAADCKARATTAGASALAATAAAATALYAMC